jgi:hypothetical protein
MLRARLGDSCVAGAASLPPKLPPWLHLLPLKGVIEAVGGAVSAAEKAGLGTALGMAGRMAAQ